MEFQPQDPGYRTRVTDSFAKQQAMQTLGIRLTDIAPGYIELTLPYSLTLTQQHGFLHGGIVATALDSACGYAAFSLMPAEASVLSIEFKVNLLAVAKGHTFRITGEVIKNGKTISVCNGHAYALINDHQKLIATMTATIMAVYERKDIQG